ncbi:MAG: hypothetical protein AABY27_03125 [Pseudomonadota bacterium]
MIHFVAHLIFILVALIIIVYKCYEIRCIKNKNGCSAFEAMKIYDKQEKASMQLRYSSNGYDSHYKPSYSNYQGSSYNDDHRHSPSYSYLPHNIHHKF